MDVTARFLTDINPELTLETYSETTDETIEEMLSDCTIAMMCIDQIIPSIHVGRQCRAKGVAMLETVGIPYINMRVYTPETISYEDFYGFPG